VNGSDASSGGTDTTSDPWEALGHCLRQAREREGLSLSNLAAKLHMGEEQLRALETGDRAHLPETVFVIAQGRRVAEALHVEINPLLEPLKQKSTGPRPTRQPLATTGVATPSQPPQGGTGLRWLGGLALVAGLAAAGGWGWQQWLQPGRKTAEPEPTAAQPSAGTKATPAAGMAAATPELALSSDKPSWLAVRNADGKTLFEGTLLGRKTFPLQGGLQVLAGRPDLVQVKVGDQEARPLGRIDQIRWVRFNAPAR
jgi:cytoskeletal protein RodZ